MTAFSATGTLKSWYMMPPNFLKISLTVALCGLASLTGCGGSTSGPQRASVHGTVKLDGVPIVQGTIGFVPTDPKGGPTSGGRIENGQYSVAADAGPVLGPQKVEIRSMKKTGKQIPALPPATSPTDEVVEAVPTKFNSKTILTETIKSGSNTINFDLKSE